MSSRLIFLVLVGIGGVALLMWLGVWQVNRLAWKEARIAAIEARIADAPQPLPATPDPATDRFMPVTVTGTFAAEQARMLASRRGAGAVHRHIAAFDTDGRRILVDLGWTPADADAPALPGGSLRLTGNLDWPLESDGFTPAPDLAAGLWYARDVPALAQALGTEPVMVVLRDMPEPPIAVTPWPVDTAGIPNDHLQYAVTWFSLAAIWAGMSLYFGLRRPRASGKG